MKLMNLTQHMIRIVSEGKVVEIKPDGMVRLSEMTTVVGRVDGIELVRRTYGKSEGLPEPSDGVMYIVSGKVREAYPERGDLCSPGDLVRDENGNVVGCKNLIIN